MSQHRRQELYTGNGGPSTAIPECVSQVPPPRLQRGRYPHTPDRAPLPPPPAFAHPARRRSRGFLAPTHHFPFSIEFPAGRYSPWIGWPLLSFSQLSRSQLTAETDRRLLVMRTLRQSHSADRPPEPRRCGPPGRCKLRLSALRLHCLDLLPTPLATKTRLFGDDDELIKPGLRASS